MSFSEGAGCPIARGNTPLHTILLTNFYFGLYYPLIDFNTQIQWLNGPIIGTNTVNDHVFKEVHQFSFLIS